LLLLNPDDILLLEQVCAKHGVSKQLVLDLLKTEDDLAHMGRRHGLYERIGEILENASK
jgi:hypothetical protein